MTKYLKWLYLLEALFCYLFFTFSNGLAFESGDGYQYVSELYSSGGEDDLAIALVGVVCVFTAVLLFISKALTYVNVVVIVSLVLQLVSLIMIQMGSIYITLFWDWNIYLFGVILTQMLILGIIAKQNIESF